MGEMVCYLHYYTYVCTCWEHILILFHLLCIFRTIYLVLPILYYYRPRPLGLQDIKYATPILNNNNKNNNNKPLRCLELKPST